MLEKNIIYVTGLPRSGSTLLCQLLSHHPEIYCSGHSSPLCSTLMSLRHNLSDSDFLLAQLDVDFERSYQQLLKAFQGFINGWFAETQQSWVVDKNRGWLQHLETVNHLDPNFKMLVLFEHLISEPEAALQAIFQWLGLPNASVDFQNLQVNPHESDSYYRFKYRHQIHPKLNPPKHHIVPTRIQKQLQENFSWFYSTFYPRMPSL